MKIAVTADLHLNNDTYAVVDKETGFYVKTVDAFKALDFFVDGCIAAKVDRVVIVGDVYQNHFPTSRIREMFNARLQKLVKADIKVVLLTGNHDVCGAHHALLPLKGWAAGKIAVVDDVFKERGEDFLAVYVPHSLAVERKKASFKQLLAEIRLQAKPGRRNILFGHFGVTGSKTGDSGFSAGGDVSAADLDATGAETIFLGHYHHHQELATKAEGWYTGSIEIHRMGETEGSRGYCVYDTATGKMERMDYSVWCRPMETVEVASVADADLLIGAKQWNKGILRLKYVGPSVGLLELKETMPKLRRDFAAKDGCYLYVEDGRKPAKAVHAPAGVGHGTKIDIMAVLEQRVRESLKDQQDEIIPCMEILHGCYERAKAKAGKWS